ncbi:MAG: hypothetical protein FI710_03045 [SAR202 cluster bacterium]|nr:hypothetical protein [SAR202 cluster bacterium]MQG53977.1 hypothetical protein [SAR202 cluster bacterium]
MYAYPPLYKPPISTAW